VLEEKLRENAIRGYGWEVVRWVWRDLRHPAEFARMLERTFARGRAAAVQAG
jgi:hypothetical protein